MRWVLYLGPTQKGRGSTSEGGPLECGVPEFGGSALSEGVWVGLGFCTAGGWLQGQRIRPRSPTGFPVPTWTGKALALFPSILLRPSPTISPRVSPVAAGQSLTGRPWTSPRRIPHVQGQRRSHREMVGGAQSE